jgi:hypothetical protein
VQVSDALGQSVLQAAGWSKGEQDIGAELFPVGGGLVLYPLRYDCQAATNRSWRSGRAKGRARGSNEGAGAPKVAASQALVR